MNNYFEQNKQMWNGWAKLHIDSEFYDLPGFKAGNTSLKHVELEEMGDVKGKDLLHLQCHFGQDTLSWAREGAGVTGVDLSEEAVKQARSLAEELNIPAQFICSNVLDLPDVHQGSYDIVYTSYGVLCWLPDLTRWAQMIHHFLKPGGILYLVEFHPFARILGDGADKLEYGYFHRPEPERFVEQGSYAAPDDKVEYECFEWPHSLGRIISSLAEAGLSIKFMHEFPYSTYNCFQFLEPTDHPERFVLRKDAAIFKKGRWQPFPLMFSIKAEKT